MSESVLSEALRRALAEEGDGLPQDFAARVAAMATARAAARSRWVDVSMFGAFVAMLAVCVAGWFSFGPREASVDGWLDLPLTDLAHAPWLVTGIVGVAVVQLLTFCRRVLSTR